MTIGGLNKQRMTDMKKSLIWASLCIIATASCAREELMPEKKQMEFRAVWADESETRTELQSDGTSVWWTPGEEINVFYGSKSSGKFTSTNSNNQARVSFEGTLNVLFGTETSAYWAVYPYDAAKTCDGQSVILTVPDVQTAKAGSFADKMFPAVAISQSLDLAFYNVCGGARFTVSQEGIQSVTFKSNNGEAIVGRVKVSFGSDGYPEVNRIISGQSEVTVMAPSEGFVPGEYYFVAFLPQTLSKGLSMIFKTSNDSATYTTEHGITVNRSRFGKLDEGLFTPVPVESVSLDKIGLEVELGIDRTLIATVLPEDAADKSVTWSSSNESIATVSSAGVVTGVAVGSAVITVTTNDGGKTASCNVTVKEFELKALVPEAVDLGLPSGLKWASFNLGASKPEEYGNYYSWGETEPKAEYTSLTYKFWGGGSGYSLTKYNTNSQYGYDGFTDGKTVLDPEDDAARVNLGGKWRMPTKEEQDELRSKCSSEWTQVNGINGRKVTGPNGNSIFLPASGVRQDTSRKSVGSYGYYWSSSLYPDYPFGAFLLSVSSSTFKGSYNFRSYGISVRPVTE